MRPSERAAEVGELHVERFRERIGVMNEARFIAPTQRARCGYRFVIRSLCPVRRRFGGFLWLFEGVSDFASEQRAFIATQRPVEVLLVEIGRGGGVGRWIADGWRRVAIVDGKGRVGSGESLNLQPSPEYQSGISGLGDVRGKRAGISEGGIWKKPCEITGGKIFVDIELARAERDAVFEKVLLKTYLVKSRAVVAARCY